MKTEPRCRWPFRPPSMDALRWTMGVPLLLTTIAGCQPGSDSPRAADADDPSIAVAEDPDVFIATLAVESGTVAVGTPVNRTERGGYDNQPQFTHDGASVLITVQEAGDTDIHRIDVPSGGVHPVTSSAPESEYSAIPIPGRATFAAVRVEADSAQRLWEFAMDGTAQGVLLEDVAPVGYHAWVDGSTVVMFVLGDPPSLQVANIDTGEVMTVDSGIGRSIQKIPGRSAVSYERIRDEDRWIMSFHPQTGEIEALVRPVEGGQDHAWTPSGHLLMGSGETLYAWSATDGEGWSVAADLGAWGRDITRLATSNTHLALVMVPVG